MAVAFVNTKSAVNATSITTSWNVTAGNLLVIVQFGYSATVGWTDSQGNTYSDLGSVGTYGAATLIYGTIVASGGAPLTINFAGTATRVAVIEFSGCTLTADVGPVKTSGANTSALQVSCTTVTPGDLVLSAWANQSGGTTTNTASIGTSFYTLAAVNLALANYLIASSVGTYTQTFNMTPGYNTGNASAVMCVLKAGAVVAFKPAFGQNVNRVM